MVDVTDAANRRQKPRRRTILGGRLFSPDGSGHDCLVKDLSRTGACLTSEATLAPDDVVQIKLTKFEAILAARVMWVRNGKYGIHFLGERQDLPKAMQRFFQLIENDQ